MGQALLAPLPDALQPRLVEMEKDKAPVERQGEKSERPMKIEWVLSQDPELPRPATAQQENTTAHDAEKHSPASAASGGYLARPSNIYAEESWTTERQSNPEHTTPVKEAIPHTGASDASREEDASSDMQLVFRETIPAADEPGAHQTHLLSVANGPAEEPAQQDDADDPKRRAAERISKLRNLSFNINAADPNTPVSGNCAGLHPP